MLLQRVAVRAGMALWRNRIRWLTGAAAVAAVGVFQTYQGGASQPLVARSGADCADTTIAALTRQAPGLAQEAYSCMSGPMRTLGEEQFVAQVASQQIPRADNVTRVGSHPTQEGGQIVFYVASV